MSIQGYQYCFDYALELAYICLQYNIHIKRKTKIHEWGSWKQSRGKKREVCFLRLSIVSYRITFMVLVEFVSN